MAVVYDVPGTLFVNKTAQKLKETGKIQPPEWAADVKTGVHRELPPTQQDWWYTRCASILRRIYMDGPVGVQRLRSLYGGKKNRGVRPDRHERGSGAVIRTALQQLEKAGYVKSIKNGRVITPAGMSFLDKIATEMVAGESKVEA
ncbi:30S ribosomal protein S19e [Methanocella sp. CWC-04]|uniref:Small ribosomal subunit protein eS19 n=1 Tax=Methanooceanicella nereidis TaxID=2052831 RepID=A0AAP2W6H2_9EURY|nr:30S ribosomal protein S19e [Methanocella sp. CWC-04]MCD1295333.1 30S ribosomal protein S19e [Methanocella sp. CWC-04]